MSFQVPTAPPPSASPPTSGAAPPGGPPGEALLHSAFAETLARTALAEGPNQSHGDGERLRAHESPRQGTHEHRDATVDSRAAAALSSPTAGALAQAPQQPAAEKGATPAATASTAATTKDAPAAAPPTAGASSERQAGAPGQPDRGGQTSAAASPEVLDTHVPATDSLAGPQPSALTSSLATATTSASAETPPTLSQASVAPATSAGEPAEQAIASPASVAAQVGGGGSPTALGADTPKAGSPAPLLTPSPKPSVEAPSTPESSPPQSAPAQSQSVAGATSAPAPKSVTATGSVDATIVREGAVAANSHLTTAPSTAGSESQQTPTQQREGAAHALTQASLAGPASGGGAVSSTVAAPPQQGEAALIGAPDPLSTAPTASLSGGVALQDMIESIHATVELAARQGMAQARIALEPEELGSLRIHLSQTAGGLLARVSADTPAAAQALAGGRAELHQSLSSLGVSLLRLDINSFSQSDTRDTSGRSTSGESRSSSTAATDPGAESDLAVEHEHPSPTQLGSGALVDVLA